jgi:Transglycosylase SLT domain
MDSATARQHPSSLNDLALHCRHFYCEVISNFMTAPTDTPFPVPGRRTAASIDPAVLRGIRQASQSTHTDFGYLMAQAAQESGFQSNAKASTSSATGLFQFIDSTWLDMVRQHGAKHGIGQFAEHVTTDASGRPRVADPIMRERILALRKDPRMSAALAGEFTQDNKTEVERALGRPAGKTDLYLAHFLGAGGATEILKAIRQDGTTPAVDILPEAASANRSVFFDSKTGEPRTVADLYRNFSNRIEQSATAYRPLGAAVVAPSVTNGITAADANATIAGHFDRSRLAASLAAFNAMLLVAIKLLGGSSASASTQSNGESIPTSIAALGRARRHDGGAA